MTTKYTFFSVALGTFSKIENILGFNTSLNRYDYQTNKFFHFIRSTGVKLKINNKRNYKNTWRLNNSYF